MRKYKKNTIKHKRRSRIHTYKSRKYYKPKNNQNLFRFQIPILYSGGNSVGTPTTINPVYVPYKDGGGMQNAYSSLQASKLQTDAYAT